MAKKKTEEKPKDRTVDILQKIEGLKGGGDFGLQLLDATKIEDVPRTSSGVFGLDLALGGGYPHGRIIEISGKEGGGKTSLGLHAIAEVQRNGGSAAMVDVEHALDPTYAQRIGVDFSKFLFSQPNSGEQALNLVSALCDQMQPGDMILVDSVANLTPEKELEGEIGDSHVGLLARLMSQSCRMLTEKVANSGVILVFINQIRMKIGVTFGSPETTTGGNALRFYSSQRLDVRRIGQLKENDVSGHPMGHQVKVKVVKNKVAPPFREVVLDLYYGYGFLRAANTFTVGLQEKIVEKTGNTYSFDGEKIAVGAAKAKHALAENPEMMDRIEVAILAKRNMGK
jgi:recombination protein RecA